MAVLSIRAKFPSRLGATVDNKASAHGKQTAAGHSVGSLGDLQPLGTLPRLAELGGVVGEFGFLEKLNFLYS